MITYHFKCKGCRCSSKASGDYEVISSWRWTCPQCGAPIKWNRSVHGTRKAEGHRIVAFEPYVDVHTTGEPTWIGSPRIRDRFLAEHGCTLDKDSNVERTRSRMKESYTANDVTFDQVAKGMVEQGVKPW